MQKQIHPKRVLIADSDQDVRQALSLVCEENHHLTVVAEASDGHELLALIRASHPDIVLLDWDLPDTPIALLIQQLIENELLTVIVMGTRPETRIQALESGADAFIYKGGTPPDELIHLLEQIAKKNSP